VHISTILAKKSLKSKRFSKILNKNKKKVKFKKKINSKSGKNFEKIRILNKILEKKRKFSP
jgi:hypothetical protein